MPYSIADDGLKVNYSRDCGNVDLFIHRVLTLAVSEKL